MDSEVSELVSGPAPTLTNRIPASAASISPTVKWGWLYVPLRGLTKTEFVRQECWAKEGIIMNVWSCCDMASYPGEKFFLTNMEISATLAL